MSASAELLSIIVPVYNEVRTSRAVIDRLLAIDLPVAREILVVNDGSTDGTGDMLDAAVREGLPITVLHAPRNAGKGSAIRAGLRLARGSIVAIQDADLELDPRQLAAWSRRFCRAPPPSSTARVLARPVECAIRHVRGQPVPHGHDEPAVRRRPDRHGNLLQSHAHGRSSAPSACVPTALRSSRRLRRACCGEDTGFSRSRSGSMRGRGPRGRRSGGATACARSRCL